MLDYLRTNPLKCLVLALAIGFLTYSVLTPSDKVVGQPLGEGSPVVIMLHGYGVSGNDLMPRSEELSRAVPGATFVVPEAPHSATGCGRSWQPRGTWETVAAGRQESVEMIHDIITDIQQSGTPLEDIYLAGFSQGSSIAVHVLTGADDPPAVRGLIGMSGSFMDDPSENPERHTDHLPGDFRVLITHGDSDRVISTGSGRAIFELFDEAGVDATFVEFEGGHTIDPGPVIEFLEAH